MSVVYIGGFGSGSQAGEKAKGWQSTHYFGGYTLAEIPTLLEEIAQLKPSIIVGHSLGSSVAWLAAMECAPSAVICTCPALGLNQPRHRLEAARRGALRLALAASVTELPELPELRPLACPALFIAGQRDALIPWRLVSWQARRLGADFLRLSDGDHEDIAATKWLGRFHDRAAA
ncbi:TPA: alpha/beta hydrolase [Aeromonas dhakensis]|nr:alpha/beta hydrolase [Aeromonas dhakensis]